MLELQQKCEGHRLRIDDEGATDHRAANGDQPIRSPESLKL